MQKLAGRGGVSREFVSRGMARRDRGNSLLKRGVRVLFVREECPTGAGETKPATRAISPDCQLCFIGKKHGNEDVSPGYGLKLFDKGE